MKALGNRHLLRAACASGAMAAAIGFAGTATAQGLSDEQGAPVLSAAMQGNDVIIVTARRRDERLIDAPVAITAVTGEALDNYSVSTVTDLSTLVPNLVAGQAASGSSASIFLRGVGSTALSAGFDQSVSFVIDGLPMSRGREIALPQFDVQRVEVLRGPQALFFGKNTTGGLISIVSNGATDYFEAGATAGYGFEADEWFVDGYVSGPISDNVRARLAGRYSDSQGAFTNSASSTYPSPIPGLVRRSNGDRRGFSESYGLRGTLDVDFSPNLNFELKVGLSDVQDGGPTDILERICGAGRTTPQPSVPFAGFVVPASPNTDCRINGVADSSALPLEVATTDYRYARQGEMYADFASQYGVLTGNLDTDVFDVTSITSYYHFKQTDNNNVSGESYPGNFTQLAEFDQFAQELRFQSNFEGAFNVLAGVFYSDAEFTFNTDAYIFPIAPFIPGATYVSFKRDNGFDATSVSAFGELQLDISPQIELSAGARWSSEARTSFQRSLPANPNFAAFFPGGIELNDRFTDTDISPQVTLRYKPTSDLTFYAAYRQGFKTGGFNISQVLSAAALLDPVSATQAGQFESETAEGGEIGVRALLFGGSLALNATAYRYEYSNLQVQVFDPDTVSLIADNAGSLRTQGIEADFNWRIPGVSGLSLRGAAAYNDAEYTDFVGACFQGQTIGQGCNLNFDATTGAFTAQDYGGRRPPKAPEFAGRLGFTWDIPVTQSGAYFSLNGDIAHTSGYNFTDTLRPDGYQDANTRFDASIAFHSADDRWSVSLIGRNLSNELVVTSANDIPFTGGTGTGTNTGVVADMSAFVDNPREIILQGTFRF
ncbi:MAG: TonB-dependent receptor [Parasphingopyxis sp.]|uniref:TonB-dependent receptor n=1 Tax=Parasphingopyxis sp. TaxID=1920299 RepID=UPI0032EF03AF